MSLPYSATREPIVPPDFNTNKILRKYRDALSSEFRGSPPFSLVFFSGLKSEETKLFFREIDEYHKDEVSYTRAIPTDTTASTSQINAMTRVLSETKIWERKRVSSKFSTKDI
ncbi:hypothetical protein TorRG33x02_169500 [Trema orientale]|uniref:Uncharacterized protein n=1 Tax=Trema orientale TaxID=63057 RepID=A0A2P5EP48_TREOI|nr:hypothetical protein TorRG33x02_169500 [Trema orientale]